MMKNSEVELESPGLASTAEKLADKVFLTRKETANLLRISIRTLIKRDDAGDLPGLKTGGRILYDDRDVKAYLRRSRFIGTPVEVESNLKHLIECLESSNVYSLENLRKALEVQSECFHQGLKLAKTLRLGEEEEGLWIEKIELVTDCMNTMNCLIQQVQEVIEDDNKNLDI